MRYIHPAAWAGLLLNFIMGLALFSALGGFDFSLLPEAEREMMENFAEALDAIQPVYYALIGLQAGALVLTALGFSFGLPLAVLGAFFMLPGSLVYLLGCALTHYRRKYADFALAPRAGAGALFAFPPFAVRKMRLLMGASFISGAVCLMMGAMDVGLILFGLACSALYCALRASKNPALTLHETYCTVSPGIFAGSLVLPYTAIRAATLHADERIEFVVQKQDGSQAALVWSSGVVEPSLRRAAIEELGAALYAHRVTLY